MMATSPGAMQLRTLQTMAEISAERNSTIIFPIPVELMDVFTCLPERAAGPQIAACRLIRRFARSRRLSE